MVDYSDLTKKPEEELLAIIRRNENSNVPGSLHQRATQELALRDRERINLESKNRSGVYLRVGGDMLFDGSIQGPKDGTIDISVAGNYKSKVGKITQGQEVSKKWWETNWFQITALLSSISGIFGLIYFLI